MQDISVVGGGIIGLSCAWRLAQRGARVALYDAREVAAEASWTAAGMLVPESEYSPDSPILEMAQRSLALYPAFVEELTQVSGVTIDFLRCGAIEIAPDGTKTQFPDDAAVNPRDVNAALKLACELAGVSIYEHTPVRDLASLPGKVLIAAGAWSSLLCPQLPRCWPVRGHLIQYEKPPERLTTIIRKGHTYLVPRGNGSIVAGTTTEDVGFNRTLDHVICAEIHARAKALIPSLLEPTALWNGFRPAIDHDSPFIGAVPGTPYFAATGHYRNGILLAPETARLVADLLCGGAI